jgi:alcohol oxidase
MDLATTNAYALPGNLTAGIGHGSWSRLLPEAENKCATNILSSNKVNSRGELKYSESDIKAIEEWVKAHTESTWQSCKCLSFA